MTFWPPKAPRRNEYLKNGNFCRNVLLRLIAPKPHLQMQTLPLDRPFCLAQILGAVSGRSGSRNRRAISLMRVWVGKGIGRGCTSADEFFTAVVCDAHSHLLSAAIHGVPVIHAGFLAFEIGPRLMPGRPCAPQMTAEVAVAGAFPGQPAWGVPLPLGLWLTEPALLSAHHASCSRGSILSQNRSRCSFYRLF